MTILGWLRFCVPASASLLARWLLSAAFALSGLCSVAAETPEGARPQITLDALSVVKIHAKAVAGARSGATLGGEREGTGVVIDSSGLILTIGYLIQEAEQVQVSGVDGRAVPASVVAYDFESGFGLLRSVKPLPIKPIEFGESGKIAARDPVLVVGFDGVAPALVVGRRPFAGYWEYLLDEAIFTAPATVNWQGAALVSREGKLLGVGSLVVGDALVGHAVPGNMFVPIDLLKPILGDLIASGRPSTQPRPWLGINTQEFNGKLIVTRVSPESPAEEAGIAKGDIIVGVGGRPLQNQADFYRKLWASGAAGTQIVLDVIKGTDVSKVSVKSIDRATYLRGATVY
jgi:S1-C subfamily serine protease